jgi:hypothetical protein
MDATSLTDFSSAPLIDGEPLLVELGGEFLDLADLASRDRLRASRLATSDSGVSIIRVEVFYESPSG